MDTAGAADRRFSTIHAPLPGRRPHGDAGDRVMDPPGDSLVAPAIGDDDGEARAALGEVAGAIEGIDNPHWRLPAERPQDAGVVFRRLLADDGAARHQRAKRRREAGFRFGVGGGDDVAGFFFADLVGRQLAKARHDLVGRHLADDGVDGGDGRKRSRGLFHRV